MAPTRFLIVLDSPSKSYFPGQNITGRVILVLDQEKNTQGLKLKFTGEAEVCWQETQEQSGSKGFRDKETYFHTKLVLLGDEKNSDVTIPTGEHEYPFTFQLATNLPSSFETPCGFVRYNIEAIVKRSWKFDYCARTTFTVNALVDLNLQTVFMEPRETFKEKSICCLCCKEGPISMRVEMPRTGYVPGESVTFSVHSSNCSSRPVTAIVVYFIREIAYRAQGRTKWESQEIVKLRGPEVEPFGSETWQDRIQIPPVPPSDLGCCKIIGVTYLLKFKLDIPSSVDLKKKIPILVGTIPFTNFLPDLPMEEKPAAISEGRQEVEQLPMSSTPPLFSQYPNMPAPIFQDAAQFDKDDGDNKSDCVTPRPPASRGETPVPGDAEYRFVPKYATYNYGWKIHLNLPDKNGLNS